MTFAVLILAALGFISNVGTIQSCTSECLSDVAAKNDLVDATGYCNIGIVHQILTCAASCGASDFAELSRDLTATCGGSAELKKRDDVSSYSSSGPPPPSGSSGPPPSSGSSGQPPPSSPTSSHPPPPSSSSSSVPTTKPPPTSSDSPTKPPPTSQTSSSSSKSSSTTKPPPPNSSSTSLPPCKTFHPCTFHPTTKVVPTFITFCPGPTVIVVNHKTYSIPGPTTLTITDCPCTITDAVEAAVTQTVGGGSGGGSGRGGTVTGDGTSPPVATLQSNFAVEESYSFAGLVLALVGAVLPL